MDKVLIIDDQIRMVFVLQRYLESLNSKIDGKAVYCFDRKHNIVQFEKVEGHDDENTKESVDFNVDRDTAIDNLFSFLKKKKKEERILIMIDIFLISKNIAEPRYEESLSLHEFSVEVYLELLKALNKEYIDYYLENVLDKKEPEEDGKDTTEEINRIKEEINEKKKNYQKIKNPDNVSVFLYSRSSKSLGIMSRLLKEKYDAKKLYGLPIECCYNENIPWVKNRCEQTEDDFVKITDVAKTCPLSLPKEYKSFIENELMKGGSQ